MASDKGPATHRFCPGCGREAAAGALFCVACGRSLVVEASTDDLNVSAELETGPPSFEVPTSESASNDTTAERAREGEPRARVDAEAQSTTSEDERTPRTNPIARAAIWFAFLVWPIGIVLSLIARRQIRKTGEGGDRLAVGALIVSCVWGALVVIVAIAVTASHNNGSHGLPPGITLSSFESKIQSQVRTTGANGFGVSSAHSTSCVMGHSWTSGATFTCFVYAAGGSELGEVDGTVLPSSGNEFRWNSRWVPTAAGIAAATPTTTTIPTGPTSCTGSCLFKFLAPDDSGAVSVRLTGLSQDIACPDPGLCQQSSQQQLDGISVSICSGGSGITSASLEVPEFSLAVSGGSQAGLDSVTYDNSVSNALGGEGAVAANSCVTGDIFFDARAIVKSCGSTRPLITRRLPECAARARPTPPF